MSPSEIRRKGLEALARSLGPVGMVRFLQQFDKGSGDYTQARRQRLKDLTVRQIAEEVEQERKKRRRRDSWGRKA